MDSNSVILLSLETNNFVKINNVALLYINQDIAFPVFALVAAAKFALSHNAFRKILHFLLGNSNSGFKSKIILFYHGLNNLKVQIRQANRRLGFL